MMDGIHDLGGKQGFGAIDVDAPPFRHDWERRQWAISRNWKAPGGSIDWWRHEIERMQPVTYLSVPYFEKWCLNDMVDGVLKGSFTIDELLGARTVPAAPPAPARDVTAALEFLRKSEAHFECAPPEAPIFALGDRVRTRRTINAAHTRLPCYARGAPGVITAHHGGHVFPDLSAEGQEIGQHLYTVEFCATDLFGTDADPRDTIHIDLWESYFEIP